MEMKGIKVGTDVICTKDLFMVGEDGDLKNRVFTEGKVYSFIEVGSLCGDLHQITADDWFSYFEINKLH